MTAADRARHPALRARVQALERDGRLVEAEALGHEILAADPADHATCHALGLLAFRRGHHELALARVEAATRIDATTAVYFRDLCEINRRLGRLDAAMLAGKAAGRLAPEDAEAHYNLGIVYCAMDNSRRAEMSYRCALALNPFHAPAWNNLGQVEERRGHPRQAAQAYARALAIDPQHALAQHHLWRLEGRQQNADDPMQRAMALQQESIDHYRAGRLRQCEDCCRQALALYPEFPAALNSLGFVLQDQGQLAPAMACFEQALQLAPQFAIARLNLGMAQLKLGDWQAGLENYEARWNGSAESGNGCFSRPACPLPLWNGEAVAPGERLLVYCEQGFGDSFQFARYLTECGHRFAEVTFLAPEPLLRLFDWSFAAPLTCQSLLPTDFSAWDRHCTLMSLPRAFATRPASIPATLPYLRVPGTESARWRQRLDDAAPGRLRVGIAWAGRREHQYDARRSLSFAQLAPLLEEPGIAWVSLQKWAYGESRPAIPQRAQWLDWTDELDDFGDTAALIGQLDLVISIDSAIVHLAGGLDVPVWMLNRFAGEWRWFHHRQDSPWYPRLRIFNQPSFGDWASVLAQVKDAVRDRARPPRPTAAARASKPSGFVALTGLPCSGTGRLSQLLGQHTDIACDGDDSALCASLLGISRQLGDAAGDARLASALRGFMHGWHGQHRQALVVDSNPGWLAAIGWLLTIAPDARMIVCLREPGQLCAALAAQRGDDAPERDDETDEQAIGAALAALRGVLDLPIDFRQRLYFVRFEDLTAHPAACMKHLYAWLALAPRALALPPPSSAPPRHELAPQRLERLRAAYDWFYALYYPDLDR